MKYKYRVWSKEHNKMIYFGLSTLLVNYNDEWNFCEIAETDLFAIHQDIDIDDVMQSIGITDRNGKDIFGSDILRIEGVAIGTVIEGRGGYVIAFADGRRQSFENTSSEHIEVVGNTWENKELIEVSDV